MKFNRKYFSQGLLHIILCIASVFALFPIVWVALASLKPESEIFAHPISLPSRWEFSNYSGAWIQAGMGLAFYNSVYTSVITVIGIILVTVPAAYILVVMKNKFCSAVYIMIIVAIMVPTDVMVVSLYGQLRSYGLLNNLWGIIWPSIALGIPLSMFILKGYIGEIPPSLIEAATIDGCSRFGIMIKIVTPLISPCLSTIAIFQFTGVWNSFFLPLITLRDQSLLTLPLILASFQTNYTTEYGKLFAAIMISFIPVLLLFVFFQRQFVQGMSMGAIKE